MFGWIKQVANSAPIQFIKQNVAPLLFGGSKKPDEVVDRADLEKDVYAQLADAAYGKRDVSKLGYTVDPELSNQNATTYVDPQGNAVVAYRGTVPTNKEDLEADAHIMVGSRKHKRFDDAVDLGKRAKQKYGDKLQVTGHSLGGTQALHVNNQLGISAHAYNPGATIGDKVTNANVRVVRDDGDIIAKALTVGGDAKHVKLGGAKKSMVGGLMGTLKNALSRHSIF